MKILKIKTNNTSSPGASFTDNTNNVLLSIYEWIKDNDNLVIPFREFRIKIEQEKGINDNNNRNIFPLLKNCGLINYLDKHDLNVSDFFTNEGIAYVDILESIKIIENELKLDEETKSSNLNDYKKILQEYIYIALEKLVNKQNINYVNPFKEFISYIIKFNGIDKKEFAYYLSIRENNNIDDTFTKIYENIYSYREGKIDFDITINIRNDNEIKEKTKKTHRSEGIAFLTSFGYFSSLLEQAGLIIKTNDKRYTICEGKAENLKKLGGIINE